MGALLNKLLFNSDPTVLVGILMATYGLLRTVRLSGGESTWSNHRMALGEFIVGVGGGGAAVVLVNFRQNIDTPSFGWAVIAYGAVVIGGIVHMVLRQQPHTEAGETAMLAIGYVAIAARLAEFYSVQHYPWAVRELHHMERGLSEAFVVALGAYLVWVLVWPVVRPTVRWARNRWGTPSRAS